MQVTLSLADGSHPATFKWNPTVSREIEVQGGTLDMDGRKYPVGYAGEGTHEPWDLEYLETIELDEANQWDALETLLDTYRGNPLKMTRVDSGSDSDSAVVEIDIWVWLRKISQARGKGPRSVVHFNVERISPPDEDSGS